MSEELDARRVARHTEMNLPAGFPRTAAQFKAWNRRVVIRCTSCWAMSDIEPDRLIQFLGHDGDVYDRAWRELPSMVTCSPCGAAVTEFVVRQPEEPTPYSLEVIEMHELEFNAFVKARDAALPKDPRRKSLPKGRRRKW